MTPEAEPPVAERHRVRRSRPSSPRASGATSRISGAVAAKLYTPVPLLLQARALDSRRTHAFRSQVRVTVLLLADALVLATVRGLWRGVRDLDWLGAVSANVAGALVPRGTFPLLQLYAAVLLGLSVAGTYGAGDRRRDVANVLFGSSLGLGLIFWARVWSDPSLSALVGFVLAAAACGVSLVLGRAIVERLVRRARPSSGYGARTILVGPSAQLPIALAGQALNAPGGLAVVGVVTTDEHPIPGSLGSIDSLVSVISDHKIDTVVFCGHLDDATFEGLFRTADAAGCQVFSLPRSATLTAFEPRLVWRHGSPLIQLTRPGLQGQQLALKRGVDLVSAVLGLIVLSPLLLAIAAVVRLTSPGPVLFKQKRVGRGGRTFQILKFRSMVQNAEAKRGEVADQSIYKDPRLFKIACDPRVTRLGKFLRRTSLDELPQLWNVVRGEMSLVGPRPPLPTEVALYEEHHYSRFDMRPGITGPWQTSGRNKITDFEEVVRLETAYSRGWTVWKDFAILLRTVPAVLKMDGAH